MQVPANLKKKKMAESRGELQAASLNPVLVNPTKMCFVSFEQHKLRKYNGNINCFGYPYLEDFKTFFLRKDFGF